MLFCVANAVFDGTENGVQNSFVSSFTGDIVLRPSDNNQVSLFGDDTPITGEFTNLSTIVPYSDICSYLKTVPEISDFTGQITSGASLRVNKKNTSLYVFGIDPAKYAEMMTSLNFIEGGPALPGEKGVMLHQKIANKYKLSVGDNVSFLEKEGPAVRLRSAPLTGIITYDISNAVYEKFALIDADTVRSLIDMSGSTFSEDEIDEDDSWLLSDDIDMDSLFDDAFDTDAIWEDVVVEDTVQESVDIVTEKEAALGSWNFMILRLNDSKKAKSLIKKLNNTFTENGWPVEAIDWRHAAGSTAMYLYWMRLIFNVGIIIVLIAGFIIINNTLVISVLDRTREFGTMRAVGAGKLFISLQCMAETFMLTISGGIIGTLLGMLLSRYITGLNIQFKNSFLVQLFGSDALSVIVTSSNIWSLVLLSVALGLVGWIYPVITALRVPPVKAMSGAK